MKPIAAVLLAGLLVWGVVALGAGPLPAELSPLKPMWDFTGAASAWRSSNSRLLRTEEGLTVAPMANAAVISIGQMDHDPAAFERMHLRVKVGDATQGRVGLVLSGHDGSSRVLVPFDVPGGGTFNDVEVSLPIPPRADLRVVEVVLVPSLAVQPAVVASIGFEPSGPWWVTAVKELWSRLPGETTALSGFSMHTLPPPVINGRSVWIVLMPIVLVAGVLAQLVRGNSGIRSIVRRCAWATAVAVWGVGFLFLFYHQIIALGVDVRRFGDRNRAEAYHLIDGVPLWEDMGEVTRLLPSGSAVEFKARHGEDPVVSVFWKGRAAYYLYPVLVRDTAPVRVLYFGGPHPPCTQVASEDTVLQDAARYCLFRVGT
ncbi:MAG: hypothetical protein AB1451_13510 [Nitrospirota bacterium]